MDISYDIKGSRTGLVGSHGDNGDHAVFYTVRIGAPAGKHPGRSCPCLKGNSRTAIINLAAIVAAVNPRKIDTGYSFTMALK